MPTVNKGHIENSTDWTVHMAFVNKLRELTICRIPAHDATCSENVRFMGYRIKYLGMS